MSRKTIVVLTFFLAVTVATVLVGFLLLQRGASLSAVAILAAIFLVLVGIPALGALRLSPGQEDHFVPLPKRRTKLKLLTLFVFSPLAVGVISLLTYSLSPMVTAVLSLAVVIAASVFCFLTD